LTSQCDYTVLLVKVRLTSCLVGAATLIGRQRLLMAGMTRLVDVQMRINLHEETYFSMVRLRACWASFVSLSTSFIM